MSTRRVPVAEPGRACEAHNAVAKVRGRSQRDRSSGINRRTGRWKAPYYFTLSRCFAAPRPSAVHGSDTGRRVAWGFGVSVGKVLPCDTPLCPAGHLPLRWGDRLGAAARSKLNVLRSAGHLPISLLVGEMPGRAEGGAARHNANRNTHTNPPPPNHHLLRPQPILSISTAMKQPAADPVGHDANPPEFCMMGRRVTRFGTGSTP
jgi:hypothetical protein